MQAYLALDETVDGLIDDAELDWTAERRARFTLGNVLDAIAPTNFPSRTRRSSRRPSIVEVPT